MMELIKNDFAWLWLLVIALLGFFIYRSHSSSKNKFDLTDLYTAENGKADSAKFCQLGAFFFSSFVIFYMTLKDGLTEWAFGAYMVAWVSARFGSLYARIKDKSIPEKTK